MSYERGQFIARQVPHLGAAVITGCYNALPIRAEAGETDRTVMPQE